MYNFHAFPMKSEVKSEKLTPFMSHTDYLYVGTS